MNGTRRIHWGRILLAGFLAEAALFALFLLLLLAATLAGVPELARPMSPLDYADALVFSFVMVFLFTLWVGKHIESGFVVHGVLIGVVGILLFLLMLFATAGSIAQPVLYVVAHVLKIVGGITGGLVAERRKRGAEAVHHAPTALLLIAVIAWAVPISAAQKPVQSDQDVLIDLEHRWNEAFYRKDTRFIESILADEFLATYDDGTRGDKAKELALAAEFNQQVESAIPDDFTVKVFRDTAVVWFTLKLVGIRQGQRAEMQLRYTDVWVIRDGRWLCVSTQSTRVNPG